MKLLSNACIGLSSLAALVAVDAVSFTAGRDAYKLKNLPYAYNALEPTISEKTLKVHHDKHHEKYLRTARRLTAETHMNKFTLEEVMEATYGIDMGLYNNAAQSWNHQFYWESMSPNGGSKMLDSDKNKDLKELIIATFGKWDKFSSEFQNAGNSVFGAGWAWLVWDPKEDKLVVVKTSGAENPMNQDLVPLLTIDVWEHAYYLDFQNERPKYVHAWLENLANWDFVSANLAKARRATKNGDEEVKKEEVKTEEL